MSSVPNKYNKLAICVEFPDTGKEYISDYMDISNEDEILEIVKDVAELKITYFSLDINNKTLYFNPELMKKAIVSIVYRKVY